MTTCLEQNIALNYISNEIHCIGCYVLGLNSHVNVMNLEMSHKMSSTLTNEWSACHACGTKFIYWTSNTYMVALFSQNLLPHDLSSTSFHHICVDIQYSSIKSYLIDCPSLLLTLYIFTTVLNTPLNWHFSKQTKC